MKLITIVRDILEESTAEQMKKAEEFLKYIIKGTEWQGKLLAAGGYVRDELMGKPSKDLDIVVDSPNGGIEFSNWITKKIGNYKDGSNPVTFPRFGTAKFNLKGVTFEGVDLSDVEIETVMPRSEVYSNDSRKPEVSQSTLKQDAERRDLTANSLFKNISTGEILDLTGKGKDDLKNGIARTPLDPDSTFSDDPLRMLRVVRFYSKYGWKVPLNIIKSMKKNASKLDNISKERINDELSKMLLTNSPDKAMKMLKITGLLDFIIPEFRAAVGMTQNKHHKHDVFQHTLDVLSKTNPNIKERLMALFHDLAKTVCRTVTPKGIQFLNHEDLVEEMCEKIMTRLKYPRELINAVKIGVKNHMRLKRGGDSSLELSDSALRRFRVAVGDELEHVLSVIHADNISHSEASSMPNQINNVKKRLELLNKISTQPKLPINGNDLMKEFGLKPGPEFKRLLGLITDEWFENPNLSKEESLEIVKKNI